MTDFGLLVDKPEIKKEVTTTVVDELQEVLELQVELAEAQLEAAELKLYSAEQHMDALESQINVIKNVQSSLESFGNTEVLQSLFSNKELDAFMPEGKSFAEVESEVAVEAIMDTIKAAGKKVWEFIKKVIDSILEFFKRFFNSLTVYRKLYDKKLAEVRKATGISIPLNTVKLENVYDPKEIIRRKLAAKVILTQVHMFADKKDKAYFEDPAKAFGDSLNNSVALAKTPAVLDGVALDPLSFKITDTSSDLLPGEKVSKYIEEFKMTEQVLDDLHFDESFDIFKKWHEREIKQLKALQKIIPKTGASTLDIKLFQELCPEIFIQAAAKEMGVDISTPLQNDDNYHKIAANAVTKYNNFISSGLAIVSKRMVVGVIKPGLSLFDVMLEAIASAITKKK